MKTRSNPGVRAGWRRLAPAALAALASACSIPAVPGNPGHGVCPASGDQTSILLADRGSEVRARIEALLAKQAVAVRWEGCKLDVLPACQVKGQMRYRALTLKRDHVRIRDQVELYANVPLSAAALSARLESAGELTLDTVAVGRFTLDRDAVQAGDLSGDCAGATHVVSAVTAGAMRFQAGASTSAKAGAPIVGGQASTARDVLSQDGDEKSCAASDASATAPPFGCGAMIRLDLVPVGLSAQPQPICSGGARWNGVQCASASAGACPAGEVMIQGACVGPGSCAPGFRFEAEKGCVPAPKQAAATPGSMVSIPGATFMMGWPNSNDGPQHRVTVASFEIDATEVTMGAFKACVEAGGCAEPKHGGNCHWGKPAAEGHPMNCVDWAQARSYCAWAGKRLPTEAEWEYAAVGQTGWQHPWGNNPPEADQFCQLRGDRTLHTCPVGSFPRGASKFGVLDQHGNVDEWVEDAYCPYNLPEARYPGDPDAGCKGRQKVVRSAARHRNSEPPTEVQTSIGFRCARSPR